ncbi:MAG: ABC transporter substrate-binding protein [Candidatus Paceibacterota bacterium]|jgi:branched-chain amino acid transport system substrate-binding protein
MNKKSIVIAVVAIIVVVLLVVFGGGTKSPVSGQTVKIGVIGPMSGDAAAYGQELQKVVSYRIAQINAKAGPNDPKFEAIYEDGKCSGNDSVNAFQKLTTIDGVKIILGGFCSSETMPISSLANENKILIISPASSNPKIEGSGSFVFTLSYSDKKIAEDLAKEMSVYKKVAIITEQNDYNIGVRDAFLEAIKNYPNVQVVSNETFAKGSSDLRSLLEKVKVTQPEAVLLNPNGGTTAETLLRQIAEVKNWSGYKLYGQFSYIPDNIRSSVGTFTEGMTIIDAPTLSDPEFIKLRDDIVAIKGGKLDSLGSYYTASTLDGIDIITGLISKLGNDSEKVGRALSTEQFKGFIGDISFSGKNFVKLNISGKYIIEDGKAVLQK